MWLIRLHDLNVGKPAAMVIKDLDLQKQLSERITIADSKKAFYKAFPHVIPPVYRRVTDELLVELHLLSHQKAFKPDAMFAIGLSKVFDSFTKGYKPEGHLESLFNALCKSSGIDPGFVREESQIILEEIKNSSVSDLEAWLKNKGIGAPKKLASELNKLSQKGNYYSRLTVIGLRTLLGSSNSAQTSDIDSADSITKTISEIYGFSKVRVERDLSQYSSNLDKINQALELMREAVLQNRKKEVKK